MCAGTLGPVGMQDTVDLPRLQAGPHPQHLILSLFANYWSARELVPSAGVVAVTDEFGITPTSARAALSRLARRGLLRSARDGRRTSYGLTADAERSLREGRRRLMAFGADDRPWDGSWLVVVFSVPEGRRELRHTLRSRLRWAGFGPLYDGVWVSPRAEPEATTALLEDLGIASATVLTSRVVTAVNGGDPFSAWDLDGLGAAYESFIATHASLRDRARSGEVGSAEALVARARLIDAWRRFPGLDPDLPEDALPGARPRRAARQVFAEADEALAPLAEARARQLLAPHVPGLDARAGPGSAAEPGPHGP
jgi:phenylacetic acid degradation operon negative regulatory protein